MLNPIRRFRNKQHSGPRLVVLCLWAVSTLNLFISPAFTIPEKDQTGVTAFQVANFTDSSVLEALLYLVYSAVNPNADLADTVEDSIDKADFIPSGDCLLHDSIPSQDNLFLPPHSQLSHADLEKFTPPPKIG